MFYKSKEDKRMQNEYEIKKEMCEIVAGFTTAEWLLQTTVTFL